MTVIDRIIARAQRRAPDFIIGGADNPYCNRWWIIPRNRFFNIYLHQFVRDDDDRALHDHPWLWNCSILLRTGYTEALFDYSPWDGRMDTPPVHRVNRWPGRIVFRQGTTAHRIELFRDNHNKPLKSWSLFITGPVVRQWGFHCPQGWRHWREFTGGKNGEVVGRGCD